jgi:hypothetical protein
MTVEAGYEFIRTPEIQSDLGRLSLDQVTHSEITRSTATFSVAPGAKLTIKGSANAIPASTLHKR